MRRAGQPVRRTDTGSPSLGFSVYRWLRIAIICVRPTIADGFGLVAVKLHFDLQTTVLLRLAQLSKGRGGTTVALLASSRLGGRCAKPREPKATTSTSHSASPTVGLPCGRSVNVTGERFETHQGRSLAAAITTTTTTTTTSGAAGCAGATFPVGTRALKERPAPAPDAGGFAPPQRSAPPVGRWCAGQECCGSALERHGCLSAG